MANRRNWLWSSTNIKGANKDAKIYVERCTTLQSLCFALIHLHELPYVTSFLFVSSSVQSKQLLCFVHGQGQKTEQ